MRNIGKRARYLLENAEIYAAIGAMFCKMRMVFEIMVFAMLNYKNAILSKQVMHENHVRQFGYFLQSIWRVSKYNIELVPTCVDVFEYVATDNYCISVLQFVYKPLYETAVKVFLFNTDYA